MADMVASSISEIEVLDNSNPELSRENINITAAAFYVLIEQKDLSLFSTLMSPDLKIYKNNEVWDYDLTLSYLKELNSKHEKVKFLPLEMVISNGEFVTVKFTETMHHHDGSVSKEKFISIFQIVDSKIQNIWELAVPTS
ncbi:MAG: hypothetical protein AAF462_10990 [Thermodesulfobacteriota bacterium]